MSSRSGTVRTTRRRLQSVDPHEPDHTVPRTLAEALPRLACALDDAAEQAGWGQAPALVRITAWPGEPVTKGFDLGVRPIDDGLSVVESLAGFTAPAEWLALGVVTEGDARHLDAPLAAEGPRRRVRCVHLVDRSGACASTLRLHGEPATVLDEHEPEGRIDDVCRRALGLATAPPSRSTVELWALVWLDRLLSAVRGRDPDERVSWRRLAELHPAVALVVHDREEWGPEAADRLVRLGGLLAEVHSWPVLRAACAAGEWPVADVPPAIAGWLDDGAFSRWVLGGFPRLEHLADAAAANLPPSLARRLRAALRAWGLPDGRA